MNIEKIMGEVQAELDSQEKKWGHEVDDTKNTPWMWAAYIAGYATKWMAGTFAPLARTPVDNFRIGMIKVAALAISAIASLDRQRKENGGAFYEAAR